MFFWAKLTRGLFAFVCALLPIAFWGFNKSGQLEFFLWFLGAISLLRLLGVLLASRQAQAADVLIPSLVLILVAVSIALTSERLVMLYPLLINVLMLALFAFSLSAGHTPLIEQIATKIEGKALSEAGKSYTRSVTKVWCCFFVFNGSLAAATIALGDIEVWTLYNGFISYLLIGALFAGEYVWRRKFKYE